MVEKELHDLIESIRVRGCEGQTIEVKAARQGCPERLYDTISAFSNQNSGGIFVFGLEEKNGFAKAGVYDAQDGAQGNGILRTNDADRSTAIYRGG